MVTRATQSLDALPGFRRRFRIEPGTDEVTARVEDDFHHMAVTLRHDGGVIAGADAKVIRAPWTTCPGAEAVLERTFVGIQLAEAARRGYKQANCTHLYDLAVLAAAHAGEAAATVYEILVSDPVEGEVRAEVRRDGIEVFHWSLAGMELTSPPVVAGTSVLHLRDWIAALPQAEREAARLLQWACLLAHGRSLPLENQSDATKLPPNCYTFQPDTAARAARVGRIIDFSRGGRQPLEPVEQDRRESPWK
jgi:hypothetical protein